MPVVLIVYESMFGDAQLIAESVARGLGPDAECVEVGVAPTELPPEVRLLVVGCPTHAFGLPSANTRAEAVTKTDRPLVSHGPGVREWLAALAPPADDVRAVTFDTRMDHPKALTRIDHASSTCAKRLRKLGFGIGAESEHFYVREVTGPLVDGEAQRAETWGRELATTLVR